MEELRLAFLVLGGLAIVGILAHGMMTVRKQNTASETQKPVTKRSDATVDFDDPLLDEKFDSPSLRSEDTDHDTNDDAMHVIDVDLVADEDSQSPSEHSDTSEPNSFDEHGIGEVRVVGTNDMETQRTMRDAIRTQVSQEVESAFTATAEESSEPAPKIYESVVTQPKPEYLAEQEAIAQTVAQKRVNDIPEPPSSLLKTEPTLGDLSDQGAPDALDNASASAPVNETYAPSHAASPAASSQAEADSIPPVKRRKERTRKRKEPSLGEDQMRIDFDDEAPSVTESQPVQEEVLVLNVRTADENPIPGSALLPMLLTLGFKFGDQDIFHRHVNSNGKGPVLFSLANMFKPGVFDIDNLENFTTQGLSLFMILPIEGDPHQVFNMMHNAARKLADEFKGQVLDGRRSALNKQSLQQYVDKIREFERKRMIHR